MVRGMKFDAEEFKSHGNMVNLQSEQIRKSIAASSGLSEERQRAIQRYRDAYAPQKPGIQPTNPIFDAELERNFNGIVELRVEASKIGRDIGLIAPFSMTRDLLDTFNGDRHPVISVLRLLGGVSDALSEGDYARVKMMQTYYKQCSEYIQLSNSIYMEEKRDSSYFRQSEMARAYVSFNRYEHFSMGNGMASIHSDVSFKLAEMEKAWMGEKAKLAGRQTRRAYGAFGEVVESIVPIGRIAGSVKDVGKGLLSSAYNKATGWWSGES